MSGHEHGPETLALEIRRRTGLNVARCYQCGKCSAGCLMASEMKYRPHDIMRLVSRNQKKRLFEDDSIWLCLTCETCTARCPNECDPARVIDAVREIAMEAGARLPRTIGAFHKSFLSQIRAHGRMFEMGLIAAYKMRSGALFNDVGAAPGMLSRGKLSLVPHNIKGLDEIRRIFDACTQGAVGHHDRPKGGEVAR